MINKFSIEGKIVKLDKVEGRTSTKHIITLNQLVYDKFDTNYEIIVINRNDIIDALSIGDRIIMTDIFVYYREGIYKFKLSDTGTISKTVLPLDLGTIPANNFWQK